MSSSVSCKKLPKDLELAYVSFVGIVMAAYIASEYHDDVENKIAGIAPEGLTYPFSPQTRLPALNFFITLASILLAIVVYFLMKAIKKRIVAKLLTYRQWIHQPKTLKTKLWMLSLKALVPKQSSLLYFQDVLPTYPLPTLEHTCKKVLQNIEPLVSKTRFKEIESEMQNFKTNEGPVLQNILEQRYKSEENWVSGLWDDFAYLSGRYSLLYTNFCMGGGLSKVDLTPVYKEISQAALAANQIFHSAVFYDLVRTDKLQPILMMNNVPICNDRYKHMFATSRIPGAQIDSLKSYRNSEHIIVFRKGQMFKLQIYIKNDKGLSVVLSPENIQKQIEKIINITKNDENELNPSIFTSLKRNDWFKERDILKQNLQNKENLKDVERALFHVCLETTSPLNQSDEAHSNLCGNGLNRWYDKSFTLTIYENGCCGGNVEHTSVDATLPSRALEYIHAHMRWDKNGNAMSPTHSTHQVQFSNKLLFTKLKWELCKSQNELITKSLQLHLEQCYNLEIVALKMFYGKGEIKKLRVSPDSLMQLALQLAFYKIHEEVPKTYETAMTRFFKLGRTETIRTVSKHSVEFTKAMQNELCSKEEKLKHLKKAMKSHNDYKLDAMNGNGCDRSLFALGVVSKLSGLELPKIFTFPEIKSGDRLSTSQSPFVFDKSVSKKMTCYPAGGAFAPQTDDGYGVYYLFLGENFTTVHISSYRSCPATSSERFGQVFEKSIKEIKDLLK